MENINVFEYASKNKIRFAFRGILTTDDLWDLTPENLDEIYKGLQAQVKQAGEESLLTTATRNIRLEVSIEIVKHIFTFKMAEIDARKAAAAKREQKKRLLEILGAKQDEELRGKSTAELQAMIEAL